MNLAQQGIGSFQPFLQAAQAAQTAGLGTVGAGAQIAAGADFGPGAGTELSWIRINKQLHKKH